MTRVHRCCSAAALLAAQFALQHVVQKPLSLRLSFIWSLVLSSFQKRSLYRTKLQTKPDIEAANRETHQSHGIVERLQRAYVIQPQAPANHHKQHNYRLL